MINIDALRSQFPALKRQFNGKPVVFADNAATSLKPQCVIDAVTNYYGTNCSNVHRGINALAQEADDLYEDARNAIAELINASPSEIIFVRNATEAINLAAHMMNLGKSDEVIFSAADHHSNFLPWFSRSTPRIVTPDNQGRLTADGFAALMNSHTRLAAVGHVSNVTGLVAPAADIIAEARKRNVATLIDGAQSVGHMPIDVRKLGCDFFAFSGHKMLGPSGIGALFARQPRISAAQPMLFGGGMVAGATVNGFTPDAGHARFEAGTPAIEGALGMGAAARFLMQIGMDDVRAHASELTVALIRGLKTVKGITLYPGIEEDRIPVASFTVNGVSAGDAAAILCNRYNIMVRSGVHCAEPLLRHFGQTGLVRVSLHVYNSLDEVAVIVDAVRKVCEILAKK